MKQVELTTGDGTKFTAWQSDPKKSFRMVHDHGKMLALFESTGFTSTKFTLFEGTEAQCISEAKRLSLSGIEEYQAKAVQDVLEDRFMEAQEANVTPLDYMMKVISKIVPAEDLKATLESATAAVKADIDTAKEQGTVTVKP